MCNIPHVIRQFLAIVCCNLLTTSMGIIDGWLSINYVDLKSENSTYATGPLTDEQLGRMSLFSAIGGLTGNFGAAPVTRSIGVKHTIHLLGLPLIACSLLINGARSVYYLYVSRFINAAVTGALVVAVPCLINDISSDNVRGLLNSIYDATYNTGIVVSFFLGSHLNLLDQAKIQLILPCIFLIVQFSLPESPVYWKKRNNRERAIKSYKFYKGIVASEAESAKFLSEPIVENGLDETDSNNNQSTSFWQRITNGLKKFQSPQAKRAFFISFSLLILSGAQWVFPIYVTDIFNKTGSILSEKDSSLLISITTLITNLLFLNVVERFNRRTLYVGSSILAAGGFFAFAFHGFILISDPKYDWVPLVCFIFIIFTSGMGLMPIPYILIYEVFPREIQEISLAITVSTLWIFMGLLGYIFPLILSTIGVLPILNALFIMCIVNALFGIYVLPETRGKSHEQIMELLRKR